jgi:hypothetical protein
LLLGVSPPLLGIGVGVVACLLRMGLRLGVDVLDLLDQTFPLGLDFSRRPLAKLGRLLDCAGSDFVSRLE